MRTIVKDTWVVTKILLLGWSWTLCGSLGGLFAQGSPIEFIEDKELLEIMIEDTTGELARNQASLDQTKAVYRGLEESEATKDEFRPRVGEYIRYYQTVIASQENYLFQLRERRMELERQELQILRDLSNFGSIYQDHRRTNLLNSILQPRSSVARFGTSGKSRLEDLDNRLFEAIGSLQERLDEENMNRQEARNVIVDREANVRTLVEMQRVSQSYYDERFLLYEKMNQTYEMIRTWRPALAKLFKPPPQPKPPDAYKDALDRMQTAN